MPQRETLLLGSKHTLKLNNQIQKQVSKLPAFASVVDCKNPIGGARLV